MRDGRTGSLKWPSTLHGVVLIPSSAPVTAQADPRSAADPLMPLHDNDRGERGAPQPKAQNPEHPCQTPAKAETWVAPSSIGQAEPPQVLAEGGALRRAGAQANNAKLPAVLLLRGVQAHNIICKARNIIYTSKARRQWSTCRWVLQIGRGHVQALRPLQARAHLGLKVSPFQLPCAQ